MRTALAAVLALSLAGTAARAALPVGATAPDFSAQASQAGKQFPFSLAAALKKGPVVLYFFPPPSPRAAPSRRTSSPTPRTTTRRWARR